MVMEKTKDPIIGFRSVVRGKDSKGRDVLKLYVGGDAQRGNEVLDTLIEALIANRDNPRGVNLTIHVGKKEHEGRTFDSAFAFVKPTQDAPMGRGRPMATEGAATTTAAAYNSFKSKQVKA
jgi:hypothetical protein